MNERHLEGSRFLILRFLILKNQEVDGLICCAVVAGLEGGEEEVAYLQLGELFVRLAAEGARYWQLVRIFLHFDAVEKGALY